MFLSSAQIDNMTRRFEHLAGLRGRGESAAGQVLATVETAGAAGLMSYCNARFSEPGKTHLEVLGVPADLAVGMLVGGAALFGVLGRFDEHGNHVANGLLATYTVRQGSIWGTNARVAKMAESSQPALGAGAYGVGAPQLYPTVDGGARVAGAPGMMGVAGAPSPQAVAGSYGWE